MKKYLLIVGLVAATAKADFITVVPFGQLSFAGNVITTNTSLVVPFDSAGLQHSNSFVTPTTPFNGSNITNSITNNTTGYSAGTTNFLGTVITNTHPALIVTNLASGTSFVIYSNGTGTQNLSFTNTGLATFTTFVLSVTNTESTLSNTNSVSTRTLIASNLLFAGTVAYIPTNQAPYNYSTNVIGSNAVVQNAPQRASLYVTIGATAAASGSIWYSNYDGRVWTYPIGLPSAGTNTVGPFLFSTNSFWAVTNVSGNMKVMQTIIVNNN